MRRASAFTLVEIAIALALVAFGVLTVLLAFPAGLKAQQFARFRILAATKAEEMVESFNASHNANPAIDTESFTPWDVPVGYRSQAFDLEHRLSSHRFGIMPVPTAIATRLDSDHDEIRRLMDEGGRIYYSQPMATTNIEEQSQIDAASHASPPANETQKLVFAVTGYAQHNALHIMAQKNWPYHAPYPSPPLHSLKQFQFTPSTMTKFKWAPDLNGWTPDWRAESACVEEASDADIQKVFNWREDDVNYGYLPFAYGKLVGTPTTMTNPPIRFAGTGKPTREGAVHYMQAALWYAAKKGFTAAFYAPATIPSPPPDFEPSTPDDEKWKQVQAMRFLAHAAITLTGWFAYSDSTQPDDLQRGVNIPHVDLDGFAGPPDLKITDGLVRYYHERCLRLAMAYAAEQPYDWGAPRPAQRCQMMDFPLIELDLFSPPLTGNIWMGALPASGPAAAQWKPIPARRVTNPGASWTYPDHPLPTQDPPPAAASGGFTWGNGDHFTLTAPFAATERCRQLVFWTVDWQSYEDAETTASAAVDASKYPFAAPHLGWDMKRRMTGIDFRDDMLFAYRNPEKVLLFTDADVPKPTTPTGTDVATKMVLNNTWAAPYPDQGYGSIGVFAGRYGADRNYDLKLSRGPLPKSVRLHAVEVARFNFYDPRVPLTIR